MATADDYPQLIEQLDDVRDRWRLLQVGEGALRLLAATAALVIAVVACDNLFWLETGARWLLLIVLGASMALGLASWVVVRWFEDRRDDFFAAVVEERHPHLRNRLINGLQLGRGNDYGSPRLIHAIVGDALEATAELDLAGALDRRPLRRTAWVLATALVALAVYAMSPRFANGFARVLSPWSDIPPYTATQVASVKPGDKQVIEGQSVLITAELTGKLPDTARVFIGLAGKAWRASAMRPGDAKQGGGKPRIFANPATSGGKQAGSAQQKGRFGFTVQQANESFDYYVAAGDGHSRQYHIEVVERPRVERLAVKYTPPTYTQREPTANDDFDGEIAALCGSTVEFELTATKPLKEAVLLLDADEPIALSRGTGNGTGDRTWRASFVIWGPEAHANDAIAGRRVMAPGRYQIKLAATDGADNLDPLWHAIESVPDQPPTVAFNLPGRDVQVQPAETVALEVTAKDDFGVGPVRVVYRVHDSKDVRELIAFPQDGPSKTERIQRYEWDLGSGGLKPGDIKPGDLVQYWAEVADRNDVTGPGMARSQPYSILIRSPEQVLAKLEFQLDDYAQALEELVRLQSENRAQTSAGVSFETLVVRETLIRVKARALVAAMRRDASPIATLIESLDDLYAGLMADCIRLLESGRDAADEARAVGLRDESLPVQDQIIAELKALLARLQRNEQARAALKKLAKTDQAAHTAVVDLLGNLIDDLGKLLADETELAGRFEKLPKKPVDAANAEGLEAMKDLEEFERKWNKWAKGSVDELTKLPAGFIDDFGLRDDVNRIFEEIEKAAQRTKSEKLEVSLEDLGAAMATKMLEDLEVWMMDSPDALKWVLEEPLSKGPLQVPEMPLPDALEDMVGDLLQEAEEFDEDADDVTSAWGDNLNQAGWGVSDGPISSFSAKGKTGNDLPNNMEVSGRSGDGRRGKSSGQMVGDTSRGLQGRKTPARVGAERYEPGQLKQENQQDPNGATGGGKKSGSGRRGLQGGTPPDFVKDMQRLSEKQAGVREKAEQVAQRLETAGVNSTRLNQSIQLMKSSEDDLRDLRYDDATDKRRVALSQLKHALGAPDRATAAQLSRARELPAELREELLQSADEGYPEGYEALLKNYFKALSEAEK
ncbi:MAG TPA: hypothetical protein VMV69_28075 [Pirellulales bacterium]|nr:hypothetical protein [Pirellulales bacterium]